MTLRDYYNHLSRIIRDNPETLDFTMVYSMDDEGNEYNPVYYFPTVGLFDDGHYTSEVDFVDNDIDANSANCVCIN